MTDVTGTSNRTAAGGPTAAAGRPRSHREAVARLQRDYQAIPPDRPVRLAKRTSNLFRFAGDTPSAGLDVSAFGRTLRVDPASRTAVVGGMTTGDPLVDPTAGSILLGTDEVATLSARALRPLRRRIQIVFQDPYRSLNPRRTVGASIIEGPMNYGLARLETLPLSLRLLREIHERLMSGTRGGNKSPGQFRESQNWIGGGARGLADAGEGSPGHGPIAA